MLIGDDHAAVDRAEEPIQQALGCHIYKRKMFYREEGFNAVGLHSTNHVMSEQRSQCKFWLLHREESDMRSCMQDDFVQQSSELRCKQTRLLIADMELMARADYLVGAQLLALNKCFCTAPWSIIGLTGGFGESVDSWRDASACAAAALALQQQLWKSNACLVLIGYCVRLGLCMLHTGFLSTSRCHMEVLPVQVGLEG